MNLRAYIYMRLLGREGMIRVAEYAALNANYLMKRLQAAGFEAAYPGRRASHEFIITLKRENREMCIRDSDQPLCDGDLLLLDAGCEVDYYASDVTRTFPVGGRFTPAQRAVYEVDVYKRQAP